MGHPGETRGDRARSIRELLGIDQAPFAERFNAKARELGVDAELDQWKVSRSEKGRRPITLDDAVAWASLDPLRRGVEWLATGHMSLAVSRGPRTQAELDQQLGMPEGETLAPRDIRDKPSPAKRVSNDTPKRRR